MRQQQISAGVAPIDRTFDAAHLRSVHHWLFQDVYSFAGQYRTVAHSKGLNSFAPVAEIDRCIDRTRVIVSETRWAAMDEAGFSERLAAAWGWINFAHPFRDGNGRAGREFIQAVAHLSGRYLDFTAVENAAWVQRSAFSMPDIDQSEPQHHWMTAVFAAMARPLDEWTLARARRGWPKQRARRRRPGHHAHQ
jgi:cell filamentation protein, protein adenylyltransferase